MKLDGRDDRCPSGRIPAPAQLARALAQAPPLDARDLWLCARAHLPLDELPDVRPLASRFATEGLSLAAADRKRARDLLDAAVSLDPTLTRASQRLLALRLAR